MNESFDDKIAKSIWENLDSFINYSTPIRFKCKRCGFERKTKPCNIVYTNAINKCNNCKQIQKIQDSVETCNRIVKNKNWQWLNYPERDPASIKCHCGHQFKISRFRNIARGYSCQKCNGKAVDFDSLKLPSGYKLKENQVYKNEHTKFIVICDQGHEYKTTRNKLNSGIKCSICANNKPLSKTEIELRLLDKGYKNIQVSEGIKSYSIVQCKNNHLKKIQNFNLLYEPYSCSSCNSSVQTSKMETELQNELTKSGFTCTTNNRSIISPYEIDIVLPEFKLGIELCGLYYHQEKIIGRHRHKEKYERARKEGWGLITIFEDEWEQKKEKVISLIKARIMKSQHRLMARKCKLIEFNQRTEVNEFLKEHHFQGISSWKHAVGLYLNQELVSVMTLGYHPRNSKLILDRYVVKSNVMVLGGAKKLFKKLVEIARREGIAEIVSFSDNRYSAGGVYKRLGFKLDKALPPDYYWSKGRKRWGKSKFRVPAGTSEKDYWESQGYYRIFDCGKDRWVYKL